MTKFWQGFLSFILGIVFSQLLIFLLLRIDKTESDLKTCKALLKRHTVVTKTNSKGEL
ncbi:hypothetical protein H6775_03750 [Candidatus Nomurabacteria bacterium]|nr:hypothetical protein [Candidatus Nomurabacteria bacterium]